MAQTEFKTTGPTVTLHVAASIDGFITRKDNTVSWLESTGQVYEGGVTETNAEEVVNAIECYVLGSRTYEHALELGWPYGDTPTVVLTNRKLQSTRKSVEFYSGDLNKLVTEILAPRYRNVWLVGGALLCQSFLRLGLVDEIRFMVMPVLLGEGLRLFDHCCTETRWRLKNVVGFRNGMVELWYGRNLSGA
jgi:dihydrofolate reductase